MLRPSEVAWLPANQLLESIRFQPDPTLSDTHGIPAGLVEALLGQAGDLAGKTVVLFGASPQIAVAIAAAGPEYFGIVDEDLRALSLAQQAVAATGKPVDTFLGGPEHKALPPVADVAIAWRLGHYLDDLAVLGTVRESLKEGGKAVLCAVDSTTLEPDGYGKSIGYRSLSYGAPCRVYGLHRTYPEAWVRKATETVLLRVGTVNHSVMGGYSWWIWDAEKPGFEESVEMIPGWFSVPEASLLRDIVESLPESPNLVQLGVWAGKSVYIAHVGLGNKPGSIVAVDMWSDVAEASKPGQLNASGALDRFSKMVFSLGMDTRVYIVLCDSSTAATHHHRGQVDLLLVDCDHSHLGVAKDCAAWLPKVKEGGLVLFHDIYLAGVRTAAEAYSSELEFVGQVESLAAYRKVKKIG